MLFFFFLESLLLLGISVTTNTTSACFNKIALFFFEKCPEKQPRPTALQASGQKYFIFIFQVDILPCSLDSTLTLKKGFFSPARLVVAGLLLLG